MAKGKGKARQEDDDDDVMDVSEAESGEERRRGQRVEHEEVRPSSLLYLSLVALDSPYHAQDSSDEELDEEVRLSAHSLPRPCRMPHRTPSTQTRLIMSSSAKGQRSHALIMQ